VTCAEKKGRNMQFLAHWFASGAPYPIHQKFHGVQLAKVFGTYAIESEGLSLGGAQLHLKLQAIRRIRRLQSPM
jgi:hypothetical protein